MLISEIIDFYIEYIRRNFDIGASYMQIFITYITHYKSFVSFTKFSSRGLQINWRFSPGLTFSLDTGHCMESTFNP